MSLRGELDRLTFVPDLASLGVVWSTTVTPLDVSIFEHGVRIQDVVRESRGRGFSRRVLGLGSSHGQSKILKVR